ncbi:uncharacterized protein CANTADRAFT_56314 [Suhomyces tanzawaensis NRRL Y-17324]|uniref:Transmembrane protein 135 N-terminal domain-containing protein n=1 Tax=Suhomyces tanzawaensis NRRL Y-17324 TaxID=984487 RepID=A0A1E4SDP6_9ASCO|nr:uncharacterized protein CANTADRAFT_56314 [Suhomyces tanzawaensis NRRL Y-17324]ODV77634.1 hypothetical protein CANTADRAFT_56314 [Suhomyces tanzawaensis NRRL Y-17324]
MLKVAPGRSSKLNRQVVLYLLNSFKLKVVNPSVKAFIFAYLYVVLPKVINHIIVSIRKRRINEILPRTFKILVNAFHPKKFPMFAANLVACINILEPVAYRVLRKHKGPVNAIFLSTFVSSLVSALIAFPGYQNHILGYGRYFSLDLTLLLVTRAVDTALSSSLSGSLPSQMAGLGDGGLFIGSCIFIMYAWFFYPENLPPAYAKWITSAANMDPELITLLRAVKQKTMKYGEYTPGLQEELYPYCDRYGQDRKRINMKETVPIDCELVHAFQTKNCELHALWRFWRGFEFAIKLYGPLNAIMLLIPKKNVTMQVRIVRAIQSSLRSSCFLGTFIGFYWYAVCLARTRVLPKVFPKVARERWDDTIAPTAGAIACGFSCFIENIQRRKELALFVAPRALGTFVPSEPSKINLKIESLVFSLSLATLVAYSRSDASKVRGIFGKGLQQVFRISSYA